MYLSNKINLIKIYSKPFVYIAVVNQRRVRGITRGVCIEKVRKVGKIKVDISDDHTGGSGIRQLGLLLMLVHLLARMHRWLHHPGLKFPKM